MCDTLLITDRDEIADQFEAMSSQLHLTRNNVFGLRAFQTAYRHGGPWLDGVLELVSHNLDLLRQRLPEQIRVAPLEGTFMAWLDLRELGLDVRETPAWLASTAGLVLSPGHWFLKDPDVGPFGRPGGYVATAALPDPRRLRCGNPRERRSP